ncbi:MAG: efflux RND transporter periplasmic adaptor subunit [Rhodothermales bacterium]|nr:efflux RND transporter periplasmic adaptor subunit [Rhodothermales bacterium]
MAKKAAKKNSNRLFWIVGGLFAVLLIGAVIGSRVGLFGDKDKGVEVEFADAEIRSITQVVTSSGKVQPEVEVKISPDVSGEIIELRVNEGDKVSKGDLLVRIQQQDYMAQVERSQAGVLQAKASEAQRRADFLNAQLELDRQKGLFEAGAVAESELQRAQTQYEVAEAGYEAAKYSVQSANASLKESRDRLNKTTIYAPMTGTVSKLDVEAGERVVGTSQMQGTEMMRIARLDQMEMEVDVNENDVVNVALGDSATLEIDAYPERQFRGIVTEIANSARVSGAGSQEQVTNFPVKIRVLDAHNVEASMSQMREVSTSELPSEENLPPRFRPGMSGTVDIYTRTVDGAVAVPIQAVTVRDFVKIAEEKARKERIKNGGDNEAESDSVATSETPELKEDLRKVVFVAEGEKAKMLEVETGISDDTHVRVVKGLDGDEKVIVGPYRVVSRTLKDDQTIREKKGGFGAGR